MRFFRPDDDKNVMMTVFYFLVFRESIDDKCRSPRCV